MLVFGLLPPFNSDKAPSQKNGVAYSEGRSSSLNLIPHRRGQADARLWREKDFAQSERAEMGFPASDPRLCARDLPPTCGSAASVNPTQTCFVA